MTNEKYRDDRSWSIDEKYIESQQEHDYALM
jgi:hypothetical protein